MLPTAPDAVSGEAFLAFAEALPEPIFLLRATGEILAANERAWALLEIAPQDRAGATLVDHVEDPAKLVSGLEQCSATRRSLAAALVLRTATGAGVACRCDGAPIMTQGDGSGGTLLLRCRPGDEAGPETPRDERPPATLENALPDRHAQASELHHRMKNNLQVLLSLIGLSVRDETDEHARRRLIETRNRVLSMAVVQKLLYQSETHATVSGAILVGELCGELAKTLGRPGIAVRVDAAPVTIGMQAAAPFGLILNELVSNALRHAFAEGVDGVVAVSLQPSPVGEIELCVADDGRGMPEITTRRLSSGLNLAKGLARQLGGDLAIDSGNGTRCLLRFPDRAAPMGLRRAL